MTSKNAGFGKLKVEALEDRTVPSATYYPTTPPTDTHKGPPEYLSSIVGEIVGHGVSNHAFMMGTGNTNNGGQALPAQAGSLNRFAPPSTPEVESGPEEIAFSGASSTNGSTVSAALHEVLFSEDGVHSGHA